MKHSTRHFISAPLLITCLSTAAIGSTGQQNNQAPPVVLQSIPVPARLVAGRCAGTIRKGYQSGRVTFLASFKKVNIAWSASARTNLQPDWATYSSNDNLGQNSRNYARYAEERQEIAAGFFVTACGLLGSDSLLVAGVSQEGGKAVVWRWDFTWPDVLPVPAIGPQGYSSVSIALPGVQKQLVYVGPPLATASHPFISGICGLRAQGVPTPLKAVVQFESPNDVFELDLTTSSLALLASETDAFGLLGSVPSLSIKSYTNIKVMDHSQMGYIYFLSNGHDLSSAPYGGSGLTDTDVRMHLLDSNRDGVLDSALELSTAQATNGGYLNTDNYSQWWLE